MRRAPLGMLAMNLRLHKQRNVVLPGLAKHVWQAKQPGLLDSFSPAPKHPLSGLVLSLFQGLSPACLTPRLGLCLAVTYVHAMTKAGLKTFFYFTIL